MIGWSYKKYLYEYNLECVLNIGRVLRVHRGKEIEHRHYFLEYCDGDELEIFIPHYFESIGTHRVLTKELENNRLKKRNLKINKLKERI